MKTYFVYIIANRRNGTLYTGVTNDLRRRVLEHKNGVVEGFTKKYETMKLVHFERYQDINRAITREKRLKRWHRKWKLELIETMNPCWQDLFELHCPQRKQERLDSGSSPG